MRAQANNSHGDHEGRIEDKNRLSTHPPNPRSEKFKRVVNVEEEELEGGSMPDRSSATRPPQKAKSPIEWHVVVLLVSPQSDEQHPTFENLTT